MPFIDSSGELDTEQILAEAIPLAKLIGAVLAVAFIPFALVVAIGGHSLFGMLFAVLGQFILAVGSGLVLMYVIVRAISLAAE